MMPLQIARPNPESLAKDHVELASVLDGLGESAQARVHYDKGLKKRLLWLIYILPTVGFLATIYFVNWH